MTACYGITSAPNQIFQLIVTAMGNLSICSLWQNQTDSIIHVHIMDSNAKSCCNCTTENHLLAQEMEKKKKELHH
eukprot:15366944-Ditylum_brightwellii.AAC.2